MWRWSYLNLTLGPHVGGSILGLDFSDFVFVLVWIRSKHATRLRTAALEFTSKCQRCQIQRCLLTICTYPENYLGYGTITAVFFTLANMRRNNIFVKMYFHSKMLFRNFPNEMEFFTPIMKSLRCFIRKQWF